MVKQGAYFGNEVSSLAEYEIWIGHKIDNILFYLNNDNWSGFDSSIDWAIGLWAPSGKPVIWSVPLTVWGTSLEQAATGAYDGHYLKAATALASSRVDAAPIYVRVGWEFNGTWMPWSAQGHEGAFVDAFHHLVDAFRSVSDRFKFVWDVNLGGDYDPAKAYPGDGYVDVVGADFYYDTQWDSTDPRTAFAAKVTEPYGLQWQQDFAAAHGKATAISEWGIQTNNAGAYVKAASDWFASHDMLYENYWETDYANYDGTLRDGSKPATGDAFKAAFSGLPGTPVSDEIKQPHDGLIFDADATVGADLAISGHQTVTVAGSHRAVLSGHLDDAPGGAAGIVEKAGDGLLVLAAGNGYSGGTVLHDGILELDVAGAAGTGAIRFVADEDATLAFTQAALTSGLLPNAIQGFGIGHDIDLLGIGTVVGATYDPTRGTLTFQDGSGVSLAALHLGDGYQADTFHFAADGHGGTRLTLAGTPATADTVILRVAEDAYRGDAQFLVTVDGVQVGGLQTAHASHSEGKWEDIILRGDFGIDPNLVRVQFVNDAYGGSADQDRNLYVDRISVNGRAQTGDAAANYAGNDVGTDAALYANGSALFKIGATGSNALTVTVSGDAYRGDAHFAVYVDGKQVGGIQTATASHAAGATQQVTIAGDFGPHPSEVRIDFVNDLYNGSPSLDRNLYVAAVSMNGHAIEGGAGTNLAGWNDGDTAGLYANGSLVFHADGTGWLI